jgi:proteasome lid subunit RPN8/RPN11
MRVISLKPEDVAVIYDHSRREFPNESCGIIVGDLADPSKNQIRPCANIQAKMKERYPEQFERGADTGYFMDPKDVREAFELAEKQGLSVIGFYHSHPNHDAYWSDEDHRAAMWAGTDEPSFPEASHLVVSIHAGAVKGAAVFSWNPATSAFEKSLSFPGERD